MFSSVGGGRYPARRVGTGRRPPGSCPRSPSRSAGWLASFSVEREVVGVDVREEDPIASSYVGMGSASYLLGFSSAMMAKRGPAGLWQSWESALGGDCGLDKGLGI